MTDITIEALKLRRRALEINIAMHQGVLEEIRQHHPRDGAPPRRSPA